MAIPEFLGQFFKVSSASNLSLFQPNLAIFLRFLALRLGEPCHLACHDCDHLLSSLLLLSSLHVVHIGREGSCKFYLQPYCASLSLSRSVSSSSSSSTLAFYRRSNDGGNGARKNERKKERREIDAKGRTAGWTVAWTDSLRFQHTCNVTLMDRRLSSI